MRVQRDTEVCLETLIKRHLELRKFPKSLINPIKIKLAPPSDLSEKRKLELAEQKTRVVQAVKGLMLFSDEHIYKNYYQLNDMEIEQLKNELESQAEAQAAAQAPPPGQEGGPGMPPEGGAPQPEAGQ